MGENAFLVRLSLEDLFLTEGPCSNDYFVSRKIERMLTTGMPKRDYADVLGEGEQRAEGAEGAEDTGLDAEGSEGGELVPWYVEKQKNCILALVGYCAQNPAVRVSGNVALSPLSIIGAMAMACRGAVQCQDLEHYCWPFNNRDEGADEWEVAKAGALKLALQAVKDYVTSMPSTCKTLNILMSDSEIKEDFKKDMQDYFHAHCFPLQSWEKVNQQVSELTKIQDKVLSHAPEATTLIQAIFFQDDWQKGFDENNTSVQKFTNEKNESSHVMMMHQQGEFTYINDSQMKAVKIPYKTSGVHAWFVMGLQASNADAALGRFLYNFENIASGKTYEAKTKIDLKIPRFKAEMKIDLKQAFETTKPPIESIFKTGHLRNMSENEQERFSIFEHMCYVQVDEKGTTAGAVTLVGASRGGSGSTPKVTFDQTFWMLIASQGKILFVAKVDKPENGACIFHEVKLKDSTHLGIAVKVKQGKADFGKDLNYVPVEISSSEEKPPTVSKLTYQVPPAQGGDPQSNLIYVLVKNLSATQFVFNHGYQENKDEEIELEKKVIQVNSQDVETNLTNTLAENQECELAFALQKSNGEAEDFWHLFDTDGNKILTLGFCEKP
jgi:serine protease inhibitor